MRRRDQDFEDPDDADDDDDTSDRDAPLAADVDDDEDDDDGDTTPCPYCGKAVFDGAEICPNCRNFLSFEDAPRRRPWWIWLGIALGLVGMLWWAF